MLKQEVIKKFVWNLFISERSWQNSDGYIGTLFQKFRTMINFGLFIALILQQYVYLIFFLLNNNDSQ